MTLKAAISGFVTIALLLTAVPASAELYVWKAADGSVHYSDRPRHEGYKKRESEEEEADFESEDLDRIALNQHIQYLAKRYSIDGNLIRAMIKVESNFNPEAVSHKGAMGLMQLMPATAKFVGVDDAYDPLQNVSGGVKYLHYLIRRTGGNLVHAIASYNAGPNAVERYNGVPPYKETQNYVRKVVQYYRAYKKQQSEQPVAPARPERSPISLVRSSF